MIIQVGSFKLTGKRVFRMAPLQHHFELLGWQEVTIVIRFWIIAGLFVALGLGIFYAEWVVGRERPLLVTRPPDAGGDGAGAASRGARASAASRPPTRCSQRGARVTVVDGRDGRPGAERAELLGVVGADVRLGPDADRELPTVSTSS